MNQKKISVVLGVDIGGTHMAVGIFSANSVDFQMIDMFHSQVDAIKSRQEILNAWRQILGQVKSKYFIKGMGIAFPAPFDYPNGVSLISQQEKFRSIFGLNIRKTFAEFTGLMESDIYFLNDAEAYLRGEAVTARQFTFEKVLLLTLGTGLGSAWKVEGNVFDADLWSNPFKEGIAEEYFSTSWFVNKAFDYFGVRVSNVKTLVENPDFFSVTTFLFDEFAANLAEFVQVQHQHYPFELLLLGGNIAKAYPWFLPALERNLFKQKLKISIKISELGEHAPMVGAASLIILNSKNYG
ncbi:ROK family protein [Mongoliitalea daihaiensis]|uniref:ROK family protein n=1 Tax=Mongoliitalea daihaiensis TaxID=2782006 RepID=UPI001F28460F|nr:ROK family protein [Mongoliitalea daihaiensis]UJP63255.1 ROK family protein [Mongoliitalea daihaiensis]